MGNFTSEDIKLAQDVQAKYGVPASVTLAQYALESGYGKSTVGANNYFNIKGTAAIRIIPARLKPSTLTGNCFREKGIPARQAARRMYRNMCKA